MKMFTKRNVFKIGTLAIVFLAVNVFYFKNINKVKDVTNRLSDNEIVSHNDNITIDENKKIPKEDRPDLAAQQNFDMIVDPLIGKVPAQRKIEAFKTAKKILSKKMLKKGAVENVKWVERGPNNVAGRTRALMFDPNDLSAKKVFAGGIGGGIWYNDDITDLSSKWNVVDDFMANIVISTIAYDPNNTQIFYVGTGMGYEGGNSNGGTEGNGLFKSIDGGNTWTQLSNTANNDFSYVQKVFVTPASTVIATTLSGIMRSTDNGETWTNVSSGRAGDIEITSDGVLFASFGVGSDGSVHKSLDDGETWLDITDKIGGSNQRRIELAIAPSNKDILYAIAGGGSGAGTDVAWFKKSIDGGETWNDLTIPYYREQGEGCPDGGQHFTRGQAFFDLIIKIHPEDPNIVILGGIDLYRSINGGENFDLITYWASSCAAYLHADQHAVELRPGYPNEMIFGNDGGVAYSDNVGDKDVTPGFEITNSNYNVTTFYSCATANEVNSNYFLAGAQDNGTQRFTQPLLNSTTQATGGDGGFCFIDQDDSNYQISSFVNNSYRLSTDGGASFVDISNDQNTGRFINPTEYDSEANILYGAGETGEMSRIKDITSTAPENLSIEYVSLEIDDRQITTLKASPHTENRLFVGVRIFGAEGKLFRIDNAHSSAPSAIEITGTYDGSHGGWISSIDVGETDDHLLATFSNYGVSSVYESKDGGTTWQNKEGNLPDMPVRWGLFNPNNREEVLLATEVGVWSTNNLSATSPEWEPSSEGLANVRCDMLKYREADGTVVVATYGRGLFTSDVFATATDADFSSDKTITYLNSTVQFTDGSLNATSWSWDFGDGESSTDQNPTHTYQSEGAYSVKLTINDGESEETKTNLIVVHKNKSVPYLIADGGDFEVSQSDFISSSLYGGLDLWELGQPSGDLNSVSSGDNAWKTDLNSSLPRGDYASALYSPAFDLSDASKIYKVKFNKSVGFGFCNAPGMVQLQYSIDAGANWVRLGSRNDFLSNNWYNSYSGAGCEVRNFNEAFPDIFGWAGTSQQLEETEFDITFLGGNENVAFRFVLYMESVWSDDSYANTDGFLLDDFEITKTDATAEFVLSNTVKFPGQGIQFTYASFNALSFAWDFGDGNTSDVKDPYHVYEEAGVYSVSLTINSLSGEVSEVKTDVVIILPSKEVPYLPIDGGDFELNQNDFGSETVFGSSFILGNSSVSGKDGVASGSFAWVIDPDQNTYRANSEARLFTPEFDFSTAGDYNLEFQTNYDLEIDWDGFIVQYTLDEGETWIKLNDNIEDGWYNNFTDDRSSAFSEENIFSGSTDGYETKSTDISFLELNDKVAFRFLFRSDGGVEEAGVAIDDFKITGPEKAEAVVDFSSESVCIGQEATFTHNITGTASNLRWDFGAAATPSTATGAGPHKVVYNDFGTFDVSLTLNTLSGEKSETKSISIGGLPTDKTLTENITTCEFSPAYITVPNSEDGVSYQLYTASDDELEGDPIVGDGNDITIVTSVISKETSYYVIATNDVGCSITLNTVTVSMEPRYIGADIEYKDGLLHADADGVEFQWFLNGEMLEGETGQTYTPAASQSADDIFRVSVVYANGCYYTTKNFFYGVSGLFESAFSKQLEVFPIPSEGVYNLKMNLGQSSDINIKVYNTMGQLVKNITKSTNGAVIDTQIDITEVKSGIYIMEVITNKGTAYKRIMKK